jgi:peptide chain release factor 2
MQKELQEKLISLKKRITDAIFTLKLVEKETELDVLEEESQKVEFWNDAENAKLVMQKINSLKTVIGPWRKLENEISELMELLEAAENDEKLIDEIVTRQVQIEEELETKETETYLGGKYDSLNAVFSIFAGAGGVDAQDWAEMLLSMLLKYSAKKNLKADIIHLTSGSEAGLKSVTVEVSGPFAYGLLKSERGVHRLVRISPYDADKARHTSFALVEVIPEIEAIDLNIPETELKMETFRASGHGGQSVNTTDSAVRITHIPTGITVSVQNERSQMQNKAVAMKILKARIEAQKEAERDKELKVIRGENMANEWGSQIRSYVLHPYQMVKDHRTSIETSDTQGVLNGELDKFVEGYLKENK